jgi:hypothetical protein
MVGQFRAIAGRRGVDMAKIENFEGDMFWDSADTEDIVHDPDEALANINNLGAIVEFEQAKRLINFFGVDCGEDWEGQPIYEYFDTQEEAEARSKEVSKPRPQTRTTKASLEGGE